MTWNALVKSLVLSSIMAFHSIHFSPEEIFGWKSTYIYFLIYKYFAHIVTWGHHENCYIVINLLDILNLKLLGKIIFAWGVIV